jgi:hypothetical protein
MSVSGKLFSVASVLCLSCTTFAQQSPPMRLRGHDLTLELELPAGDAPQESLTV